MPFPVYHLGEGDFQELRHLAEGGKVMKKIPRINQEITKLCKPAACINKHTGNKLLRDLYIWLL